MLNWWTQPPADPRNLHVSGIAGVPTWDMYSLDEALFGLSACDRHYGWGASGRRARQMGWTTRCGKKWSVIIVVDIRVGVVTFFRWEGTMSAQEFFCFVRFCLIPALAGTGPRQGLYDNHSAHHATALAVDALCRQAGHPIPQYGPVHTPQVRFSFLLVVFSLALHPSLSVSLRAGTTAACCTRGLPLHAATSADPSSPTADPASLLPWSGPSTTSISIFSTATMSRRSQTSRRSAGGSMRRCGT